MTDLSVHEVETLCGWCHRPVIVGGYTDDLPDPYRCLSCRTAVDVTPKAPGAAGALEWAKKAAGV